MRQKIEEKVKEILSETVDLEIPVEQITTETDLMDLGVGSLSFIRLIVSIETEFQFQLDLEQIDFNNFKTFGDLITCIERRGE